MGDLLLAGLFIGLVLWVGWPVTLWAGCAGVLAWGARCTADRSKGRAGARALADALFGAAMGLGVVWLAQVTLTGMATLCGVGTVRSAEASMAASHEALGPLVHPVALAAGTALALLVRWRGHASRVAWPLASVGSLLFFGGQALRSGEVRWVVSRRSEASLDLGALRAAQTGLVATAEVRRRLEGLSAQDRDYLASFVHSTESKNHRTEIVAEKAERLAAHTIEPAAPPDPFAATAPWVAVLRCETWLNSAATDDRDRLPSLDDLDALARTARELQGREAETRSSLDSLARAIVDATAPRWTGQAWGEVVRDLRSAEGVVASSYGPDEPWPVVAQPESAERSATVEVDDSEHAFEVRDRNGDGFEWADPSGVEPDPRAVDPPASE